MERQIVNAAEEWFVHYGGSEKNRPLSIKSATVINSKDVHFGDRTYYDGPVVIKQYILVDDDEYLENELEGGCIEGDGGGEDRDEVAEDVIDCVGSKVETDADCDGYKGSCLIPSMLLLYYPKYLSQILNWEAPF